MPRSLFFGRPKEWLETRLVSAQTLAAEGKTTMQWSDSGTSAGKQFSMPLPKLISELLKELGRLDPTTYPPAPRSAPIDVGTIPR